MTKTLTGVSANGTHIELVLKLSGYGFEARDETIKSQLVENLVNQLHSVLRSEGGLYAVPVNASQIVIT